MSKLRPQDRQKQVARPTKVLSVGLPGAGSYSMCLALEKLGYKDVYHGVHALEIQAEHYDVFASASDRLFPNLPTYNGKGMTADDWDEIFAPCEGITDIAGFCYGSILQCYPEAKVMLVERPFESWYPSIHRLMSLVYSRTSCFVRDWIEPLATPGGRIGVIGSSQKNLLGWSGARDPDEMLSRDRLRKVYDRHYASIRELVPPERLLEYRLGSG